MKRNWTTEELIDYWTLLPNELELVGNKIGPTCLGFAVLLKFSSPGVALRKLPRGKTWSTLQGVSGVLSAQSRARLRPRKRVNRIFFFKFKQLKIDTTRPSKPERP